MAGLARFSVRWWWLVLLAWGGATLALQVAAPPFAEVATFDETAFLGDDAPAIRGGELLAEGWPEDDFTRSAIIVFARDDGPLTDDDQRFLSDVAAWFDSEAPRAFGAVSTHLDDPALEEVLVSSDGQAAFIVVGLELPPFTPPANEAVAEARSFLDEANTPSGLQVHLTGSAGVASDESAAIDESVNRTHLLTLVLVATILLWVYRSPVAPIVPLITIGIAFLVALGTVSLLAQLGMDVSSLYETFSIVIVFGAGTDYCLFLISRYHEELDLGERHGYVASPRMRRATLTGTMVVLGAVIASSAGTTIAGFSAQAVAEFGMFRTMGPAMAIAVAITLAAALTLTPALMRLFGRWLFWPDASIRGGHAAGSLVIEQRGTALRLDAPLERRADRPGDGEGE
ncbi:MAG: MMPL family transporter [Actinobacteria bacterium]|nr:MMPL family transporter [Actinomycetota bacterium]